MNPDRLLTPSEAAAFLGLQVQTLALWRCTGRVNLPYVRCGRSIRYKPQDLATFVSENTAGAAVTA